MAGAVQFVTVHYNPRANWRRVAFLQMTVFDTVKDHLQAANPDKKLTNLQRLTAGAAMKAFMGLDFTRHVQHLFKSCDTCSTVWPFYI